MELPEVQTIPESTLIASYASELGAAANFASFDTESGKLTIEEGDTNESHVGQHLLQFTATDANGLTTLEAFFVMIQINEIED